MDYATVVEQLWAWLYATGKTVKKVKYGDKWESVGLTRQDVEKSVKNLLPAIVDKIGMAHTWDFAVDVATKASEADQNEYTLRGNNYDCADIINVRYGEGRGVVINELDVLETDRREGEDTEDSSDTQEVYAYTLFGRSDDDFPKIQLFDTPTAADTIRYRYRKKGLRIEDIPDQFSYVVNYMLKAEYEPAFMADAERLLKHMIMRIKVGGDSPMTIRMNPVIEQGNIRRGDQQGGC